MQIVVEVVNKGLRPEILPEFEKCPLVPLMKDCWAAKPESRPLFKVTTTARTSFMCFSHLFAFQVIVQRLEKLLKKQLDLKAKGLANPLPAWDEPEPERSLPGL